MAEYTEELFLAARAAGSKEELIELASGAEIELTDEEVEHIMALKEQSGVASQGTGKSDEISVDELGNVTGGCKDKKGREIVTIMTSCLHGLKFDDGSPLTCTHPLTAVGPFAYCDYCTYEKGIWYCNWNVKPH